MKKQYCKLWIDIGVWKTSLSAHVTKKNENAIHAIVLLSSSHMLLVSCYSIFNFQYVLQVVTWFVLCPLPLLYQSFLDIRILITLLVFSIFSCRSLCVLYPFSVSYCFISLWYISTVSYCFNIQLISRNSFIFASFNVWYRMLDFLSCSYGNYLKSIIILCNSLGPADVFVL